MVETISAKDIFKPTVLKCFLPALVFILIIISFFVNSSHIPPAGENLCDYLNYYNSGEFGNLSEKIFERRMEYNTNPQEIINLYNQIDNLLNKEETSIDNLILKDGIPLVDANLYLLYSGIYTLNPFFPVPCETFASPLNKNSKFCRYYISEESFNCLNLSNLESGAISSLFEIDLPEYNKISFGLLLINGILLALIIYLIVCIIYFLNVKLSQQTNITKIIINVLLLLLPIFLVKLFNYYFNFIILIIYPFILIFVISSFIKKERTNSIFLYIMAATLIAILIGGIFITNLMIKKQVGNIGLDVENKYTVLNCENTKFLSIEEKRELVGEDYLDEEWNVCYNPLCEDGLCTDYCYSSNIVRVDGINLRGDSPSCLCICSYRIK